MMCQYSYKSDSEKSCPFPNYWNQALSLGGKLEEALPLDERGICLFHSHDIDWKKKHNILPQFKVLIDLLNQSDFNRFDFTEIILVPDKNHQEVDTNGETIISLKNTIIKKPTKWNKAIFEGGLDLSKSEFYGDVDFFACDFKGDVILNNSCFNNKVYFSDAHFKRKTRFNHAIFKNYVSFTSTVFGASANFTDALFVDDDEGGFQDCRFKKTSYFVRTQFLKPVRFNGTTFEEDIYFDNCLFKSESYFQTRQDLPVVFKGFASFLNTNFQESVYFEQTVFEGKLIFNNASFNSMLDFQDVQFGYSNFDNLRVSPNSVVVFQSNKTPQPKVFGDLVSIKIREEEIKGNIIFKNANLQKLMPSDLQSLQNLENFHVSFDEDCVFSKSYKVIEYDCNSSIYDVLFNILEGLKKWIRSFSDSIKVEIQEPERSLANDPNTFFKLRVKYERKTELELFGNLYRFYYQQLQLEVDNPTLTPIFEGSFQSYLDSFVEIEDDFFAPDFNVNLMERLQSIIRSVEEDIRISLEKKRKLSPSNQKLIGQGKEIRDVNFHIKSLQNSLVTSPKNAILSELKLLIGDNKGEHAIDETIHRFGNNPKFEVNKAILLKRRFVEARESFEINIISNEELSRQVSKINLNLLSFLDSFFFGEA